MLNLISNPTTCENYPTTCENYPTLRELVSEVDNMRDKATCTPTAKVWRMNEGWDSELAYCGTLDGITDALADERAMSFYLSPDGMQVILFGTADPFEED